MEFHLGSAGPLSIAVGPKGGEKEGAFFCQPPSGQFPRPRNNVERRKSSAGAAPNGMGQSGAVEKANSHFRNAAPPSSTFPPEETQLSVPPDRGDATSSHESIMPSMLQRSQSEVASDLSERASILPLLSRPFGF